MQASPAGGGRGTTESARRTDAGNARCRPQIDAMPGAGRARPAARRTTSRSASAARGPVRAPELMGVAVFAGAHAQQCETCGLRGRCFEGALRQLPTTENCRDKPAAAA
jgi:hypothetical protein